MAKLTPEKKVAFLAALGHTGIVARACEAIDISRVIAYEWRKADPVFAKAWDDALEVGVTALEDEANRRAFEGVQRPVFHRGELVGNVREYSDTLAIFMLKAHKPEKYRENRVQVDIGGNPEALPDVKRIARISALFAAAQNRASPDTNDVSDLL